MTTVIADGLTKRYGDVLAVDDVSFTLEPSTVTGFLGPNGAGKSTTLQMLLGLTRPSAGSATYDGVSYGDLRRPALHVGAVLERAAFHPGRSARASLDILADLAGVSSTRVRAVLADVGLSDDAKRRVGTFSLGMRQRLALAAALLGDPQVLLLDEPMNGLDPDGIRWMRQLLRQFAAEGRTVLISSHGLHELATSIDRALVIGRGRLLAHVDVDRSTNLEAMYLDLTSEVNREAPAVR